MIRRKTLKQILVGLMSGVLILSACQSVFVESGTPTAEGITPLSPSRTPIPTFKTVTIASATSTFTITPTVVPTLNPIRNTPPTLMLHRPNLQFDSVAFLKEFIKVLKGNNLKVVTYRDIYENPNVTATEQGKLFIITIDDIYLAYPMDHHIIEMIEILQDAGYPAVLGVVTETDYPYPDTVAHLKVLSDLGWEIGSHTDSHANLEKLERASSSLVYKEVSTSLDKLNKAIGIRPITLILPDGQMVNYRATLGNMNLHWVVGINGGITYDSRDEIIYVGREGPAKNAEYTYKIMKLRFKFSE
jgi:peptidoglycan/xylan/chitin deacetylase (PgdA/CDA1 family)